MNNTYLQTAAQFINLNTLLIIIAFFAGAWIAHRVTTRRKPPADFNIRFYTDASSQGSHGVINVTNRKLGLIERDVNFVLEGVTTPPMLTPVLLDKIWTAAQAQGYTPHGLPDALEVNHHAETPMIPKLDDLVGNTKLGGFEASAEEFGHLQATVNAAAPAVIPESLRSTKAA